MDCSKGKVDMIKITYDKDPGTKNRGNSELGKPLFIYFKL